MDQRKKKRPDNQDEYQQDHGYGQKQCDHAACPEKNYFGKMVHRRALSFIYTVDGA